MGEKQRITEYTNIYKMLIIPLDIDAGDESKGHGVDKEAEPLNTSRDQDPVLRIQRVLTR